MLLAHPVVKEGAAATAVWLLTDEATVVFEATACVWYREVGGREEVWALEAFGFPAGGADDTVGAPCPASKALVTSQYPVTTFFFAD